MRSKFGALRKRWMVKVGLSTRGIPPCYLLMILTNPHPPTHKHEKHKTHWVTAANTHTIQHTSVQKKWRINSVNGCSLLYPVSVCLSLCSVDSYSCPLLSSTTQSYQGTLHTIQLPLLTLAMNLQLFPPWEKWQQCQAFFSTLRHLIILFYLWLFVEGVSPGTPKPQCDQRVKSSVFRSIIP